MRGESAFVSRCCDHFRRGGFARGERCGERIAAGQRGRNLQRRCRTLRGIFFQAAQDDSFHERVNIFDDLRRMRRGALSRAERHLGAGGSVEEALAGKDLVEYEAERVEIAFRGHFAARELFRGHVGGSSGARVGAYDFGRQPGQAEIGDAHAAASIEHDVRGLQISVNDAMLVGGSEAGTQLPRDLDGLVRQATGRCGASTRRDLRRPQIP